MCGNCWRRIETTLTPFETYALKSLGSKGAAWVWSRLRNRLIGRRFKQVFGAGIDKPGFTLVYGELALNSTTPKPYVKLGGNPQARFSISRPVSQCELRAASYLSSSIGNGTGCTPALRSDNDVRSVLDLDFISFGGPLSNFKTEDCQLNANNLLAIFDQPNTRFLDRKTGNVIASYSDPTFDYGIILKLHPKQFPDRVWLACAGFGEWGTSGGAWYLANRWMKIRESAKDRPFAAVVRVRVQQDESAECIELIM
jgi:hypothetical protein